MDVSGPTNALEIRNESCARGSILLSLDEVAEHMRLYGWLAGRGIA
jgi:hypothetical protein